MKIHTIGIGRISVVRQQQWRDLERYRFGKRGGQHEPLDLNAALEVTCQHGRELVTLDDAEHLG
jgi:hypothetical protein